MKPVAVHHLLLTRFNIRSTGAGWTPDQSPEWLGGRFDLFARYCAPTVASQTNPDFDWIIFCDPDTAETDLARLRAFDPRIRIAFHRPAESAGADSPRSQAATRADGAPVLKYLNITPLLRPGTDVAISTRLDSDDGLAREAMAYVRSFVDRFLATPHDKCVFNPRWGYKLNTQTRRIYQSAKASNPFISLFERVAAGKRCAGAYERNHAMMHKAYPTHNDDDVPLWLQVIHGGNVLNAIGPGDLETSMEPLDALFEIRPPWEYPLADG